MHTSKPYCEVWLEQSNESYLLGLIAPSLHQQSMARRKTMRLTDKQLIHRQYLSSPVWAAKRLEALKEYGPVCNRCGLHGTDVHHKTYVRTGGEERIEDLEILCRSCHEAHHRVERVSPMRRRRRGKKLLGSAAFRYLTNGQKKAVCEEFGCFSCDLYNILVERKSPRIERRVCEMLGLSGLYGKTTGELRSSIKSPRTESMSLAERKALEDEAVRLGENASRIWKISDKRLRKSIQRRSGNLLLKPTGLSQTISECLNAKSKSLAPTP